MIGRMSRRISLLVLLWSSILGCAEDTIPHSPGELTIAAASSLRPVIDEMIDEWNATHPDLPARASYGSSGSLYAQIDSAAPFDLFLCADDVYAQRLFDRGVVDKPFRYATGKLVIWIPGDSASIENPASLLEARFEKIAIASPNLAPYGEASLEALEGLGIYDEIKGRLLFAGNASEALHYAESGGADAAILPLSLVLGSDLATGHQVVVPSELHDEIIHEGAIISATPDRDAAQEFVEMLMGDRGRSILNRVGFETDLATSATATE